MERVLETLSRWRAEGVPCALARVVATGGSAPLAPGTAMVVAATGAVAGGVSGGCVDGAVFTLCQQVLDDGRPVTTVFGPDGDELLGVGPTCGGNLEVFVELLPPRAGQGSRAAHPVDVLARAVGEGRPAVAATVLDGPRAGEWAVRAPGGDGDRDDDRDDDEVPPWARGPMAAADAGSAEPAVVPAEIAGRASRVFVHPLVAPRLLVFGATAFAEALVPLGAGLGYRVTVCDARPVFAAAGRFPAAEQVVRCWPDEFLRRTPVDATTAICVLTHDPKFDIPLLLAALNTAAGYVGAMGSRRTHAERVARLSELGVSEAELSRLSAPIGLDLGARTAAETALSIAAELVAHRRSGTGARLVEMDTSIHRRAPSSAVPAPDPPSPPSPPSPPAFDRHHRRTSGRKHMTTDQTVPDQTLGRTVPDQTVPDQTAFHVPIVDLTPYVATGSDEGAAEGTADDRTRVAREIDEACSTVGFIQIVGHGIPPEVIDGLAGAIDDFFALPLETKKAYRVAGANRGYSPPKSESLSLSLGVESADRMNDFFEAFNVGVEARSFTGLRLSEDDYGINVWPEVAHFRERVETYFSEASRVARVLTRVFADALGQPPELFDRLTDHSIDVLRMVNYALDEGPVTLDGDLRGMGEHTDFGLVTVLWADRVAGLQVLGPGGVWHDVQPVEGGLLVNLGDLTARLTNDRWMSTLHRVAPPVVDGRIMRRRSAAFFHDGNVDAVVETLPEFAGPGGDAYDPVTVRDHIAAKLAGSRHGKANTAAVREAARVRAAAHPPLSAAPAVHGPSAGR